MSASRLVLAAAVLCGAVALTGGCGGSDGDQSSALPRFTDSLVATVPLAIGLAFTPDRRLLVTSQTGALYVIRPGALHPRLALDLRRSTCSERERGMSGVAVDPDFATNRFVYLYFTFRKRGSCAFGSPQGPVNRLSRFRLGAGDRVEPASEFVLLDNIPSFGGTHNAGDIHFGRDGYLYVSVGDGGRDYRERTNSSARNEAARDLNTLLGKIVRITARGGIPGDNPYRGAGSVRCARSGFTSVAAVCREIFATGLRNPFRLAFDPNATDTRFFINDVGQGSWEEIDEGASGADYGWNVREGPCAQGLSPSYCPVLAYPAPRRFADPVYAYPHRGGCGAISGGTFVPRGVWPTFDRAYLFADFNCGSIFALWLDDPERPRATRILHGLHPGLAVSMIFGPYDNSQALYYTTYSGGGEVRRVTIATSNR
ncbi:MAG: hypothetical protein QOI67_1740 [Gaiellaceae bacterium]|nr:hypothetical protein [Gaiellaceae bacterium]